MAWDIKDVLSTLGDAMQLEVEGRRFYLAAATRTRDQSGKKMFASLAADETEHLEKLKKERDQIAGAGKWLSAAEAVTRQPARWHTPIFNQASAAETGLSANPDDVEALRLAMNAEKESYDLYAESRDKIADPDGKALFDFLAVEEKSHFELLQSAMEYLTNTATFFLVQEGAINEG
ncbi:MAG: ferritin-like domain-containing protein [Chloroflexota bacterium]